MTLLSSQDRDFLKERFEGLDDPVVVKLFTQSDVLSLLTIPGQPQTHGASNLAKMTKDLLVEVTDLTSKLSLEVHDVNGDGKDLASAMGIEFVPAIVLGDDPKGRVRFYGAPMGNEFPTILESIDSLSNSSPRLGEDLTEALTTLVDDQVNIKVFVTPT